MLPLLIYGSPMAGNVVPLHLQPIQHTGYHCFVNLYYCKLPVPMVLDTGASRTIVDTAAVERMDLSHALYRTDEEAVGFSSQGMKAQMVQFPDLRIGRVRLKDWTLGAFSLEHINNTYRTMEIPPVSGVMGNDLLVALDAKIDIGRRQMRVWSPAN